MGRISLTVENKMWKVDIKIMSKAREVLCKQLIRSEMVQKITVNCGKKEQRAFLDAMFQT